MTNHNKTQNRMLGFDPFALFEDNSSFQPGTAELIIGGTTDQVIGRMAAFMLLVVRTHDGKAHFSGITVIAPPKLIWNRSDEEVLELILNAIHDLRGTEASAEEVVHVKRLLSVVQCKHLDMAEVLKIVATTGEKQLLLFPDAGKYQNSAIPMKTHLSRTGVVIAEDQWVPHVASLTSSCIELAKSRKGFLVFAVTEPPPARECNQSMLNNIDGLYPSFLSLENHADPSEIILNSAQRWVAMAATGRVEEALTELNETNIDAMSKSQLAIQIASRSEDSELTARIIREELIKGTNFPPEIAARFGRIAERVGDETTAQRLLDQSIEHITNQDLLEAVLISCTALKSNSLVQRAYEHLMALFPDSELLRSNCELRLMQFCQLPSSNNKQLLPSKIGFSSLETYLANHLGIQELGSYESLLEFVGKNWGSELDLATICCAINAHANGNLLEALKLAISAVNLGRYEHQAVNMILTVMRRMMLLDEVPQEDLEIYKLSIQFVIRYLATHPADAMTRITLTNALSVESCGAVGLPIMASLALDIAKEDVQLAPKNENVVLAASEEELKTFFQNALSWLESLPVLELGVTSLPQELTSNNPQGILDSLAKLIHFGANRQEENTDLDFLEQCVHLTCLLAPYAPEGTTDLDALRLLACKYWLNGHAQKSRDIAEQIMELAGNSLKRQRFAWASYADIYHRTRSPINALVGAACAFSSNAPVDSLDIWQETYTLLRITRDLNLHEVAKNLLSTCRKLYALQGMEEEGNRRLDTIEISLRFSNEPLKDLTTLSALVIDATKHCADVIKHTDEVLPAASLLAQAIGLLERAGGQVEPETREILDAALNYVGPQMAEFLEVVSATTPTVVDILNLHNRLDNTRNSEDVPGDLVQVVMVARRFLRAHIAPLIAEDVLIALELLAERAVEPPDGARKLDAQWPADYAKALSSGGLAVLMLGLDEKGNLVSILAKEGTLEIEHSAHQVGNLQHNLMKWSINYPYRYGLINREEGNNEFYISMRPLDIPVPKFQNVLVIAEPTLQQIPLNLVLDANEFAGKNQALGYAPSLTWFEAARRNLANHDGRRLAWLSVSEDPDQRGTLEMILDRLRPTFELYNFHIDTSRQIPKSFVGAQMAVVTAHGSLTTDMQFIHKISDEEALAESPIMLARSLAGIELVILFVCSGGRIDKHPLLNTTVSLPKLLLDRGCRTVIASPWPLAAVVTGPWLEGFMEAWESGETALTSTFKANQMVEARLGDFPSYALAMAVHGDVLLRKC